jgi:hypothetical protein
MSQKPPRRQSDCEMYNHDTDGQIIYICSGHKVFNNNMLNFQIRECVICSALDDFQSNRPQVKSSPVKSTQSQNGLKMEVKSTTYFKLNKKLCINMN